VPRAVLAAAYRWWSIQPETRLPHRPGPAGDSLGQSRTARERAFWVPYIRTKRRKPDWFPRLDQHWMMEDL
jgi:hypothetical protein